MKERVNKYLRNNLFRSFKISPFHKSIAAYAPIPIYIAIAAIVGVSSGMFRIGLIDSKIMFVLPVTLFVFPSLFEEVFFRGILIPIDTSDKGKRHVAFAASLSTMAFVLWHPLNALLINPTAVNFFLNPHFLVITALLGFTCSIAYIYSRSIWAPILIHWISVVVWVLFLGGRNKILEM